MADDIPPPEPSGPEPVGQASAVRPFLLTAGRVADTTGGRAMPVETQVVATAEGLDTLDRLAFERRDIVDEGRLTVHVPDSGVVHDASVLRRVIEGLRAIPDARGVLSDSD